MAEKHYEKWVDESAEAAGWLVRKLSWQGRRAAPDKLYAKDGRVVFIEWKDAGEGPTTLQARQHREMRDAGMEVHCLDSPYAGAAVLQIPLKEKRRRRAL